MRWTLVAAPGALALLVFAAAATARHPAPEAAPATASPATASRPATAPPPASAPAPATAPAPGLAPTPSPAPTPTPSPAPTNACAGAPADMVCISGGAFRMGSIVGDDDEKPLRPVIVSAFLLDKYEVSFGKYMRCVEAGRCGAPRYVVPKPVGKGRDQGSPHIKRMPGADRAQPESARQTVKVKIGAQLVDADLPVAGVTWFDAREYCSFVGKHLPTEAQWEFAARGSKGRYYAWGGEAPDCSRANSERCGRKPMPTSSLPKSATPEGVLNLTGNVWEWVNDWYDAGYYGMAAAATDPIGPLNSQDPITGFWAYRYRAVRGGSWSGIPSELHASYRFRLLPSMISNDIGFRCARSGLALDATAPTQAAIPAAEPPPPVVPVEPEAKPEPEPRPQRPAPRRRGRRR